MSALSLLGRRAGRGASAALLMGQRRSLAAAAAADSSAGWLKRTCDGRLDAWAVGRFSQAPDAYIHLSMYAIE